MEDKYGFTPELGQVISNPYAKSFVNEVQEPEVISQLRNILKNKQNAKVKDPKSGKMMRVDSFSASAVIAVYDAINDSNKKNFGKLSLPKMVNVAFKVAKVRKENAVNNHDGKAAPYGSGYKKVNENEEYVAYATKGKKVVKTIRDSEYNDDLFSKFKKDMERKGLDVYIDLVKNRKVVRQVYRTNESLNEAKYKHTYKSITDQQKDLKRIFPSGHPRVSVKAYHDMNPQGKMKTSYVEIEGPSSYVDAYKKMAFNGKKTMRDVIKFVEKNESVNEAFVVAYGKGPKPIKPAFAAYADKKMAQKFMADMKKDGYKVMMTQKKIKGIDEGKKRFRQQDGIGKSKYTISYHDGKQKHKDGSDFFGIKIFKNKKDLESFRKDLKKQGYIEESVNEGYFKVIDQIRQDSKDARDFIKNVMSDPDFKDMKNDKEFLKYLKSIYEGFSSDAQRRAAFASGYKAKGKKGKKEQIEEYDVENYQDVKEFVEFMKEYEKDPYALNPTVNEAEYQGRDVKLGKIMQGDVKKFKVYVKNPKGNVVKVNFGHKGKGGEKTMRIKKSDPARRKAFRSRHNCDNPGPRHKARYWACRTW